VRIWVDADAGPQVVKEILVRADLQGELYSEDNVQERLAVRNPR
jgi:uncharacterized protein YaiI (UPF0178 family)